MKIITELNEKPVEGDILFFNGKKWILVRKSQFLYDVESEIVAIKKILSDYMAIFHNINDKLESHHNILQQLTEKEGE